MPFDCVDQLFLLFDSLKSLGRFDEIVLYEKSVRWRWKVHDFAVFHQAATIQRLDVELERCVSVLYRTKFMHRTDGVALDVVDGSSGASR